MYRVKYLDELGNGDEVWVYGNPFSSYSIADNPLKVVGKPAYAGDTMLFESRSGFRQVCSKVWEDTYIFRRKPTPAELLAMCLNGIDIGERKE